MEEGVEKGDVGERALGKGMYRQLNRENEKRKKDRQRKKDRDKERQTETEAVGVRQTEKDG